MDKVCSNLKVLILHFCIVLPVENNQRVNVNVDVNPAYETIAGHNYNRCINNTDYETVW